MDFSALTQYVKSKKGIDLSLYKKNFLERRVLLRMNFYHINNINEYLELLKNDMGELEKLIHGFNIHVSQFFRNPELFQRLKDVVLPDIFKKDSQEYIFLSAGCATGEEPYSLAILLLEEFEDVVRRSNVRIYGVDISEKALDTARKGIYSSGQLKGLPIQFRQKYFTSINRGIFEIKDQVRKMVEFKRENIFEAKLKEKVDLILCRNLLIYLNREAQLLLISRLKSMLKHDGYIALGNTETIYTFMNIKELQALTGTGRIYVLKGGDYAG